MIANDAILVADKERNAEYVSTSISSLFSFIKQKTPPSLKMLTASINLVVKVNT